MKKFHSTLSIYFFKNHPLFHFSPNICSKSLVNPLIHRQIIIKLLSLNYHQITVKLSFCVIRNYNSYLSNCTVNELSKYFAQNVQKFLYDERFEYFRRAAVRNHPIVYDVTGNRSIQFNVIARSQTRGSLLRGGFSARACHARTVSARQLLLGQYPRRPIISEMHRARPLAFVA